jgi:hypothetical protein
MRADMFEVIIERPRWGILGARKGAGRKGRRRERTERALERAPKIESMSIGAIKELNENLAPLLRFLRSRAGRPWNAVVSEMRAQLSVRSAVQKHVMDHVRQLVETNPVFVGGRPHHPEGRGPRRDELSPLRGHPRWPSFYVCPKTGLLRIAPRR